MPLSNNTDEVLNSAQASDKSVGFLNDIFGVGWDKILEGVTPAGGAGTVVFELFFAFNAVILACVAALMFYVISAGVVGTAHEGESLGKRYSTLWTPIRGAFAISLLMPLPWVKLALIQAILLKFLFFSIGGADYLAVKSVEFMAKQNGAITAPAVPMPQAEGLAGEILKNLVVQEYFQEREEQSYGQGVRVLTLHTSQGFVFTPPDGGDVDAKQMGSFTSVCLGKAGNLCFDEANAGMAMADELRPVAKAIVSKWSGGSNTPMDDKQESAYRNAITKYASASQQAAVSALSSTGSTKEMDETVQAVKNNGWVWLATYYWKIARFNEDAQLKVQAKLTTSSALDETAIASASGKEIGAVLIRYRDFIGKVEKGRMEQKQVAISSSDSSGTWKVFCSLISDAIGSAFGEETALKGGAFLVANTIATGDPISNLQKMGHSLINTGGTMLVAVPALKFGGWAVEKFNVFGLATTFLSSNGEGTGGSGVIGDVLAYVASLMLPIGFALIAAGAVLAYYLPALPFILFTSAIVGWLILSIELMVAAPIWAAMHAIPEGEGMAGQHGKQGYILFFGILLRPALHVMGFFIGFLLVNVIGHFVGEAYLDFTTSNNSDEMPVGIVAHFFGWIATVVIGSGVAIFSSHKAFSLITWLPDHILRWSGGNSPSLGEGGDEQRSSHMFVGAVAKTQGALTSAITGGGSSAAKKAMTPPKQPKVNHAQGNK